MPINQCLTVLAGYAKPCTPDDFRLGAACIVQAQQQPNSKAQMWKQAAHLHTAATAQARVSNSTHKYSGPTTASLLKAAMETQWEEQQKSNHATELGSAQMDQRQLKRKAHRKETDSKRSKLAEQSASQVLQRGAIGEPTLLICFPPRVMACKLTDGYLRRMKATHPNSKVVIRKEKSELHRMFDLFQWSKWPPHNSE